MINRNKPLSVLILLALAQFCFSDTQPAGDISQYEFTFRFDVNVPGNTPKFRLRVPLPKTIPGRQKITKPRFSPQPSSIISENGTNYAEFFVVKPPKRCSFEIKIKADIYDYDLIAVQKKGKSNQYKGPDFDQYLKPEKFIESNDVLIRQAAEKISAPTS